MADRTCLVRDCEAVPHGRGYCKVHYLQLWRSENRDKVAATNKKWAVLNGTPLRRARKAAANAAWREENRLSQQSKRGMKRARYEGVLIFHFDWSKVLDAHGHSCHYCGTEDGPFEMEHMVPLARNGAHAPWNVVPSCRPCNNAKGMLTAEEFSQAKVRRARAAAVRRDMRRLPPDSDGRPAWLLIETQ